MTKDTRDLLQAADIQQFQYREITWIEEQQQAAARWPLLERVTAQLAGGPVIADESDEGEADDALDRQGDPEIEVPIEIDIEMEEDALPVPDALVSAGACKVGTDAVAVRAEASSLTANAGPGAPEGVSP